MYNQPKIPLDNSHLIKQLTGTDKSHNLDRLCLGLDLGAQKKVSTIQDFVNFVLCPRGCVAQRELGLHHLINGFPSTPGDELIPQRTLQPFKISFHVQCEFANLFSKRTCLSFFCFLPSIMRSPH